MRTGDPAAVRRPDLETLLTAHQRSLDRSERALTDPRPWIEVNTGPAWDSGTSYSPGDLVEDGSPTLVYRCVVGNTNHEPGVDPNWANYWTLLGPAFQNSWTNVGDGEAGMRYRFLRDFAERGDGAPGELSAVELQGSIHNGVPNSTVFALLSPAWSPTGLPVWQPYLPDFKLRLAGCDDSGSFLVLTVDTSGAVIHGFS
jgi:hypothetical protein